MRRSLLSLLTLSLVACGQASDPEADASTSSDASDGGDASDDLGGADSEDTGAEDGSGDPDDVVADSGADAAADTDPDAGPACTFEGSGTEAPPSAPRFTPRWAFLPWISKDISTGEDSRAFVDGFLTRGIPVGVLVLDSPWETSYNTFIPNPARYPEFETMITDLRDDGVRTVLWVTQMVNRVSFDAESGGDTYVGPASNYAVARDCGFFIQDGEEYSWWKGFGSALDFFDPRARQWWHEQQNALLDMGIAGWKLDFGEQYVSDDPVLTEIGEVSHQAYSEAYYRDFLAYGAQRVGVEEFVTMVRPYDESYQFDGRFYARPEDAPVAWVGDNRRDWFGFVDALDHTFRSAIADYIVVGSDIGGYLDRNDDNLAEIIPFDEQALYAWIAQGALTPFMELHGRANLEPWNVGTNPDTTVEVYRYWATLHTELVPFWFSLAQESYAGHADGIIRPVSEDEATWVGDWRYMLGDALLVAPITAAADAVSGEFERNVLLPDGHNWLDWYDLGGDPIAGGTTVEFRAPWQSGRIPVYLREGAIVPLEISNDVTGIGEATWADSDALLLYPPGLGASSAFVRHDTATETTTIDVVNAPGAGVVRVSLDRVPRDTRLVIRELVATSRVLLDSAEVTLVDAGETPPSGTAWWSRDPASKRAIVFLPAQADGVVVELPLAE